VSNLGLVVVAASLFVGGCAAPQRRLGDENRRLSVEVAELRAQARADRRLIRDLEHRLALMGGGAGDAVVVQEAPTARPRRLEAEPPGAEPMTQLAYGMAAGDDEVEIVYEAEAAQPVSRRPRLTLHERSRSDDGDDEDARPIVLAPGGDLPVTRGGVPTVDAQLRRARSAPVRGGRPAAGDPREEYQRFYAALAAGNHAYAVTGFRHFVARYPDHDFADNAQYWLGESYYDQKDYKSAAAEFKRVVDRYPRGNKVADALLKLGYCHAALGRDDEARAVLRQVVERYPKTAPARLAGERLAVLERKP
jgi:tol-pal system protein YbgF